MRRPINLVVWKMGSNLSNRQLLLADQRLWGVIAKVGGNA